MPSKPLVHVPHRQPASAVDAALDKVTAARREAEWQDTVRLAEQVFPREWNVRVEHFAKESFVTVQYPIAYGSDPIDALKKAIDWYRQQNRSSRIVLPPTR